MAEPWHSQHGDMTYKNTDVHMSHIHVHAHINTGWSKKITVGIVGKTSFLVAPTESYFIVKLDPFILNVKNIKEKRVLYT